MKYLKQLIADGANEDKVWAEFESTAIDLDGCLCRRIPLNVARRLSTCLPLVRAYIPGAARYGTFKTLLHLAMPFAQKPEGLAIFLPRHAMNMPTPGINDANTEDCLCGQLDEDFATEFVEAVMRVRAARPGATTYGVFLALLSEALNFVEHPASLKRLLDPKERRKTVKKAAARPSVRTNVGRVRGV